MLSGQERPQSRILDGIGAHDGLVRLHLAFDQIEEPSPEPANELGLMSDGDDTEPTRLPQSRDGLDDQRGVRRIERRGRLIEEEGFRMLPSNSTGVCMTRAARRRRSRGSRERISHPSKRTVPVVGSTSRLRHRSSVDLPEPDGPTNVSAPARSTVTETSLRIVTAATSRRFAYTTDRCSTWKTGGEDGTDIAARPSPVIIGGRHGPGLKHVESTPPMQMHSTG